MYVARLLAESISYFYVFFPWAVWESKCSPCFSYFYENEMKWWRDNVTKRVSVKGVSNCCFIGLKMIPMWLYEKCCINYEDREMMFRFDYTSKRISCIYEDFLVAAHRSSYNYDSLHDLKMSLLEYVSYWEENLKAWIVSYIEIHEYDFTDLDLMVNSFAMQTGDSTNPVVLEKLNDMIVRLKKMRLNFPLSFLFGISFVACLIPRSVKEYIDDLVSPVCVTVYTGYNSKLNKIVTNGLLCDSDERLVNSWSYELEKVMCDLECMMSKMSKVHKLVILNVELCNRFVQLDCDEVLDTVD